MALRLFGTISASDHSFTARRVLAATSAQDLRRDYLSGNVLSRSGNTLVVAGFSADRREQGDDDSDEDDSRYEIRPVTVLPAPTMLTRLVPEPKVCSPTATTRWTW